MGAGADLETSGGFVRSTVALAVDEAVAYGLAHRDLSEVTHIGIDEISRKRGHVYVTNVYDLNSRRLLWSGEGRAKETLEGFFDWYTRKGSKASAATCGSLTPMSSRREPPRRFWCLTSSIPFSASAKRSTRSVGRDTGERATPQAADGQDTLHLAGEPLKPHRQTADTTIGA